MELIQFFNYLFANSNLRNPPICQSETTPFVLSSSISLISAGTSFLFKRESSMSLDFDIDLPRGISDAFSSNNRPLQLPSV